MNTPMQVKGSALVFLPKHIRKTYGEEGFELWLSRLSVEAMTVFHKAPRESEWFPLRETLIEPTAVYCQLFHNWDIKGAWTLGRASADYGLGGIYRLFVRWGSPEFLINKAGQILPTYYSPSAIEVVENVSGSAILRINSFPEIDKLIEYRIGGWIEAALEICGCREKEVLITKSLTQRASCTEYQIHWER